MTREKRKELYRYKRGIDRLDRMLQGKTILFKMDPKVYEKLNNIVIDAEGK